MAAGYTLENVLGAAYSGGDMVMQGSTLYSPCSTGLTRIELEHGHASYVPAGTHTTVRVVCMNPSGSLLLCVDSNGGAALTSASGTVLHRMRLRAAASAAHESFRVHAAAFDPSGSLLAVAVGSQVQLWHAPTGSVVHSVAPLHLIRSYGGFADAVTCLRFSGDGHWLIAGSLDMTARVFSTQHLYGYKPPILSGHRSHVISVFLDGSSAYTATADGAISCWECIVSGAYNSGERASQDASADSECLPPHGDEEHMQPANSVPNNFSAGKKKRKRLANQESSNPRESPSSRWRRAAKHLFGRNRTVTSVDFYKQKHDDSILVLAGFAHGVFTLHKLPTFERLQGMSVATRPLTCACFGKGGDWLTLGCETLGQVLVWEWRTEQYILKQQSHAQDVNSCSVSPGGSLVVTGGDDCKVKVWDARMGTSFATFSSGLELPVSCVRFLPNGNAVLASCLDGTIRAFDLLRYRNFRTLVTPEQCHLSALAVDPSGEIVAAGSSDGFKMYTWSLKTGKLLEAFGGHEGPISTMSFSPTAPSLATGSWDTTVRIWDVFEGKGNVELLPHQHDVLALAHSPDGKLLAVATLDGHVTFWDPNEALFKGLIEGRRDVKGGRLLSDKRVRSNSPSGRCFSTLAFSADSSLLIAGGNSKHICMYDVKALSLLGRFEVSSNRSIDGVLDQLPSYEVLDGGPQSMLPNTVAEEDDVEGPMDEEPMPGTQRSGYAPGTTGPAGAFKRNKQAAPARCRCLAFSPTGRSFVAATNEGLLQYSKAVGVSSFSPIDLSEDATPASVQSAFDAEQYSRALVLALRLNEDTWIKGVLEHTPPEHVYGCAQAVPSIHARRLVEVSASFLESSPHLEHAVHWLKQFLLAHGPHARKYMPTGMGPAWRAATKALSRVHEDLSATAGSNLYMLQYLTSLPPVKVQTEAAG